MLRCAPAASRRVAMMQPTQSVIPQNTQKKQQQQHKG